MTDQIVEEDDKVVDNLDNGVDGDDANNTDDDDDDDDDDEAVAE